MGKKIIVTGCAGFVGSYLTESLLFEGHTVFGLDNLSTGSRNNMNRFKDQSNFHFFQVDVSQIKQLEDVELAMDQVDMIYHLAAAGSVPRSMKYPGMYFKNNLQSTSNMLEIANDFGVELFVNASSSSVYGEQDGYLKSEYMIPNPQSPYACYKHMSEQLCEMYEKCFGVPTVSFRFFNVYGPRQAFDNPYAAVIPKICAALIEDKEFVLYGDGHQSRDFTYIDNVTEILCQCLDTLPRQPVYNIGCNHSVSINQLIGTLEQMTQKKLLIQYEQPRKGDVRNSLASISQLQTDFDYTPITHPACLNETLKYYEEILNAR